MEEAKENPQQKPTISFEQFEALDVRMCLIRECSDILKNPKKEKSDDNPVKAYKLLIDTGFDKRECVTNLIEFTHKQLIGRIAPFILNLPVSTIRGVESHAMILVASKEFEGNRSPSFLGRHSYDIIDMHGEGPPVSTGSIVI